MISMRVGSFGIGACLGVGLGPHGCAQCPVELGAAPRLGRPQSEVKKSERQPSQIIGALPGKVGRTSGQMPLFGPDREAEEMRRYAKHFRNQLKARLLRHLVAIQVVRETTLAPDDFLNAFGKPVRKVQDPATLAWHLCTTAFFKGEGKPWRLASVREGVCYIGLVFKRDPSGDANLHACCGAQMFLNSGDGVVFRGAFGKWWRQGGAPPRRSGSQGSRIARGRRV